MAFICLNVFGPAEGFRAFRITQGSVTPDTSDQLSLSSGEAEVSEGAEAFRLLQKRDSSGKLCFELSIFRQVYEFRARRLGHTMGASILFDTSYPGGDEVVFFLRRILDELSSKCCTEPGVFGTLESLRAFCEDLSESVTETIIPAFSKTDNKQLVSSLIGLNNPRNITSVVHATKNSLDATVSQFFSGFCLSLGSIVIGRVLFFDPDTTQVVREYKKISCASDLESIAISYIANFIGELDSIIIKNESTIHSLKTEFDSINAKNSQLIQQLTQAQDHVHQLDLKLRDINTKYYAVVQAQKTLLIGPQASGGKFDNPIAEISPEIRVQLNAIDKSLKGIASRIPEPRTLIDEILFWLLLVLSGCTIVFGMSLLANYVKS
jgi:hypothetical protein